MTIIREGQEGSILQYTNEVVLIEKVPKPFVEGVSLNTVGVVAQITRIADNNEDDDIAFCSNLVDFEKKCGGYLEGMDGYLYAKNHFDANGGSLAVVSATSGTVDKANVTVSGSTATGSVMYFEAKKGGTYDNATTLIISPTSVSGYFNYVFQNNAQRVSYDSASTLSTDTRYIKTLMDKDSASFVNVTMFMTDGTSPITGTYSFSGGTNGVATGTALPDLAYIGSESGGVRTGIQKFKETDEVIEVESARMTSSIRSALVTHVQDVYLSPRRTILTLDEGTSVDNALTEMTNYNDDKVQVIYPRVKVANPFTNVVETVSPVSFKAALDTLLPYNESASQIRLPATVRGVETSLTNEDVNRLAKYRISPIRKVRGVGIIYEKDITSSSNVALSQQSTRKAKDYLGISMEDGLRPFVSKPITPELWRDIKSALDSFLKIEARAGRIGKSDGSTPYSIKVDSTNNPQEIVQRERVIVEVEVSLLGHADKIYIYFDAGVDKTIINTN